MLAQYLKFFINGGTIGVVAWGLQWLIYNEMGGNSGKEYSIAAALTYAPLVGINFMIQRKWIFNNSGVFFRFAMANFAIMIFVSLSSPLCRTVIDNIFGSPWGDRFGFVGASLIGSIPSFFITRIWVFGVRKL
ncbi:MAG: hypothetical protein H0Z26_07000 [Candidatus Nitrotoga sp.]|nr:hypothetical protein [Candidatus Nitrotoga sp.]